MRVKSADDMMATWGITLKAMWHGDCQYFGNAGLCGPQLYRYERQFAQCETWLKKKKLCGSLCVQSARLSDIEGAFSGKKNCGKNRLWKQAQPP